MKYPLYLITILIFQTTSTCYSQNYKPGFYTTINGDTLKGWLTTPDNKPGYHFNYTMHPDSPGIKISITACKTLHAGEETFITWYGNRTVSYIDKIDQSIITIDSGITETIPLRLIFSGKRLSLYHFNNRTDYFFIREGDTIQQLVTFFRRVGGWARMNAQPNRPAYEEYKAFRNQLVGLMGPEITEKQMNWIEATEYTESSLKKFLKKFD